MSKMSQLFEIEKELNSIIVSCSNQILQVDKYIKLKETTIPEIFKLYNRLEDIMLSKMPGGAEGSYGPPPIMDQHKQAACLCVAIIMKKPLIIRSDENHYFKRKYLWNTMNEQLGIISGIYIIELYNRSDTFLDNDIERYIRKQKIKFPKSMETEYKIHLTRLMNNLIRTFNPDKDNSIRKRLDITQYLTEVSKFLIPTLFLLSNTFFLIESYSNM